MLTEKQIIVHLSRWIDHRKYPFQLPNSFIYNWESDYWAMDKTGVTREYEIKISKTDYRKDAEKEKHRHMGSAGPNYFYYVCPTNLIKPVEVDKKYGLIYVTEHGNLQVIKRPLKLHNKVFENWRELCVKLYWKWYSLWKEKYLSGKITREEFVNKNQI